MFTKNFYKTCMCDVYGNINGQLKTPLFKTYDGNIVRYNWKNSQYGSSYAIEQCTVTPTMIDTQYDYSGNISAGTKFGMDIAIGYDDTPERISDYSLNFVPLSKYQTLSLTGSCTSEDYVGNQRVYNKSIKNISTENIVVKEMGLMMYMKIGKPFLFNRKVLDEPVVLKPNEVANFTFTIGGVV